MKCGAVRSDNDDDVQDDRSECRSVATVNRTRNSHNQKPEYGTWTPNMSDVKNKKKAVKWTSEFGVRREEVQAGIHERTM